MENSHYHYIVSCTSCGRANRIPAAKEGVSGRCGHCRARLRPLYHQPHPMTERTFDDFVQRYDGPIMAEFWAPW